MIKKLKTKFMWIIMSITTLTLLGVFVFVVISTYNSYENNCKASLTRAVSENRMGMEDNPANSDNNPAGMSPDNLSEIPPEPRDNKPDNEHNPAISGSAIDSSGDRPMNDSDSSASRSAVNSPNNKPDNEPDKPDDKNNPFRNRRDSSIMLIASYSETLGITEKERSNSFTLSEDETNQLVKDCIASEKEYGKLNDYSLAYMYRKGKNEISIAFYDTSNNENSMRQLIITFLIAGLCGIFLFYMLSLFLSWWCIRPIEQTWQQQKNFVADASHELKTPLTVILANASLLRDQLSKPLSLQKSSREYEKYLDYIGEEAGHMSRLINDMLFLAKSDAQRDDEVLQPTDFSDICLNCYLSFESVAYDKKITIDAELEENIQVAGSPEKLSQLCAILLDNACKYTEPEGSIRLFLYRKAHHVTLRVNNSGTPISKEQLSHLFDRFYRVDEARTRSNSGFGLGLSIAMQIVELHKGKIEVLSTESDGTTFIVRLPV